MHKLIAAAAITLWIVTVAVLVVIFSTPDVWMWAPIQRVTTTAAAVLTLMWWMDRCGLEYRIGYRSGKEDKNAR